MQAVALVPVLCKRMHFEQHHLSAEFQVTKDIYKQVLHTRLQV